jgi:hypothetical protein
MLALMIVSFGILSRMVVHTPNFTPVLSLALFGGMYLKERQGIWVPLVLMAISDVVLGLHSTMVYTWGSILMISLMGLWLKSHKSFINIISASVVSSVLFFLVTNFGDFLSMYPHSWAGLQECYIMAIPFYRSTLVSTMAYSLVLFSLWEFLLARPKESVLNKAIVK